MRVLSLILAAGFAVSIAGLASASPTPGPFDPSFLNGVQSDYMRRGNHARAARGYRGRGIAVRRGHYRRAVSYPRAAYFRRAPYYRGAAHYRRAGYHRRIGHYRPYRGVGYYYRSGYRHYRHRRCYYRWHPVYGSRLVCRRPYRPHVSIGVF
ncbi:MAG TPA: hypothetical protein VH743_04525 [Beijerinckiaceae bacterium]